MKKRGLLFGILLVIVILNVLFGSGQVPSPSPSPSVAASSESLDEETGFRLFKEI